MRKQFFLILSLFIIGSSWAQDDVCKNSMLNTNPILAQGRVKPFEIFATESLQYLTGKKKTDALTATEAICMLSLSYYQPNQLTLNANIDHPKVRELLNLSQKTISYPELINHEDIIREALMPLTKNDDYKKALTRIWDQIQFYNALKNGQVWTILVANQETDRWHTVGELNGKANGTFDAPQFLDYLQKAQAMHIKKNGDSYLLELTLARYHIFIMALVASLILIFFIVLNNNIKWHLILATIPIGLQVFGITLRVLISGRAPITNMYETVLFSGLGALIIAWIISLVKKDKQYLLGGLGYNILCLMMMEFAHNMLDPKINPLVPVLRDNFWLSTHVTCIILSYAALALSWMQSNIVLFKWIKKPASAFLDIKYEENLIYNCIKIGVVLLSAGIILGGIWADYSWGRFWGWDPKETWSLIVLLFYMALLHARQTKWVGPARFILLSGLGFLTVMMAWFGVNYILASGLHSYGFSEGGALFLAVFFITQIIITLTAFIRVKNNE